jgi:uncharacterized protein (TIGR00369 family)
MTSTPLQFPLRIPFVEELGLELWAFGDGQAELRVDLAEAHLNSFAVAHGGVLMTMLDVAMAHAARSGHGSAPDQGPGAATIEMKTSFMRPAEGRLRALGRMLHATTTMAFTEGSVFNEAGLLCAHATATFKFMHALPTKGRQLKILQRAAARQAPTTPADPPDTP